MIPVIHIGQLSVSTYWLMFFVGVAAMFALIIHRRHYFGLSVGKAVLFALMITICGVISTKALHFVQCFDEVMKNGLTWGGMSVFGAVLLIPVLMIPCCKLLSMRSEQTTDACSICGLAMIGFLRFGCFFAGCCGGIEGTLFGVTFQWPTQAIESIGDFLILAVLYQFEKERRFVGKLYPLFMISYSVMRFFIEFVRIEDKNWLFMSQGQWLSLLSIAIGVMWLLHKDRKRRNT